MALDQPARRRRKSALPDNSLLGMAINKLEESRSIANEASRVKLQQEALHLLCRDMAPTLADGVAGWIDALGFLADADIFYKQIEPLRVALIELGRGVQDQRLVAKGKTIGERPQGGAANTSEMILRRIAVEAFEALVKVSDRSASEIENELEADAEVEGGRFNRRTLQKWKLALSKAPAIAEATDRRSHFQSEGEAREYFLHVYSMALSRRS